MTDNPRADQRRERYDQQRAEAGEKRVNARFDAGTLKMLDALAAHHGSAAEALRAAVRREYAALLGRRP